MLKLKINESENIAVSPQYLDQALFETILIRAGQPVFLSRHLNRMAAGLVFMKMDQLPSASSIREAIIECLSLTGTVDGAIKLMAIGNILHVLPRTVVPASETIAIGISETVVRDANSSLAGIKTVQRVWSDALRAEAARNNVYDFIALNSEGNLTEGGRTNIFLVQDERLVTPPLDDSCLPGVTRSIVLEMENTAEVRLNREDLVQCEAAFLTSALIGAAPIAQVIGIGKKDPHHPLIQGVQAEIARAIREDLNLFR